MEKVWEWPIRLFKKSVLKQQKYTEITNLLGATEGLRCLDIGSDNGVISYLLRQRGGKWKSADLDYRSIEAMRELVETDVYQIDGGRTPFETDEFDCVVIVDFLEHISDDSGFMKEIFRILKPGGVLILNAPNLKLGWLMRFRQAIGLTEEAHGHLRPGYDLNSIQELVGNDFSLDNFKTYTKFPSKFMDTLMVLGLSLLKKDKGKHTSGRGILVTGKDLGNYRAMFAFYTLIYPLVWVFSRMDHILFTQSGYMLIARARSNKKQVEIDHQVALQVSQPQV